MVKFYCVKCKARREVSSVTRKRINGRMFAIGICPKCGIKMYRIGG